MNPLKIAKVMGAKNKFEKAHPLVVKFFQRVFATPIPEGTIIEMVVKKPGEEPLETSMKVQQSDLELVEMLKNINEK